MIELIGIVVGLVFCAVAFTVATSGSGDALNVAIFGALGVGAIVLSIYKLAHKDDNRPEGE